MAQRAMRVCSAAGCNTLTREASGRCPAHPRRSGQWTRSRASQAAQQLYDSRWAKASKAFLQANPLCRQCELDGRVTAAECTDHIVPHRGDYELFWDETNWQPLCGRCHRAKTMRGA